MNYLILILCLQAFLASSQTITAVPDTKIINTPATYQWEIVFQNSGPSYSRTYLTLHFPLEITFSP